MQWQQLPIQNLNTFTSRHVWKCKIHRKGESLVKIIDEKISGQHKEIREPRDFFKYVKAILNIQQF